MTNPAPLTPDTARDSLRARIEAAERPNAERSLADQARAAADAAVDYTRAHPLTVIGGALAVGLLLGLATRPGRRVASKAVSAVGAAASGAANSAASGVKGVTTAGGAKVATLLGEAAMAYAMKLLDELLQGASDGQDKLGELCDGAAKTIKSARETTSKAARSTQTRAARAVRDVVGKVKR
ncbi:MAG: hypothetical protein NBV60_06640 [Erythrobacter sp.]|nr:hypothetical protein [Erythrobacter sp.]